MIVGSGWSQQIESIINTDGTCTIDVDSNDSIIVTPSNVDSSVVRCSFIFKSGTSIPSYSITTELTLPRVVYYQLPIWFEPTNTICMNEHNPNQCTGTLSIPLDALPIKIKTTSVITINNTPTINCPHLQIQLIRTDVLNSSLDNNNNNDNNKIQVYQVSLNPQLNPNNIIGIDYFHCNVDLTKSLVSPYLHFYDNNEGLITSSRSVLYSNVAIITSDYTSNCYDNRDNICTLVFEIHKAIPKIDQVRIQLSNYFIHLENEHFELCHDQNQDNITTSRRDPNVYNLYCYNVRKPIETISTRPVTTTVFETFITLYGEYIEETILFNLQYVKFNEPVWFTYDDYCADSSTPFCGIEIRSKYQGPALTLTFMELPFDNRIEYLDCSTTNQMTITTTNISFPSNTTPPKDKSIVRLPPGANAHLCTAYVAISYGRVYPTGLTFKIHTYHETGSTSIRHLHPDHQQSVIGDDDVVFDVFPIKSRYDEAECQNPLLHTCTIYFETTRLDSAHYMNWMRSFTVYIPGLDSEFTSKSSIEKPYTWGYTGFRSINIKHSIQEMQQGTVINTPDYFANPQYQNTMVRWYFSFELSSEYYGDEFYQDINEPTVIWVKYRKAPDIQMIPDHANNIYGVVPNFLSYAQSPVHTPPPPQSLFRNEADKYGFKVLHRPNWLLYMNKDCDDPQKMTCKLTFRRWTTDTMTYFLLNRRSAFKNVQLDALGTFTFLDGNLNRIIGSRPWVPWNAANFVFTVDTNTLPIAGTGITPDGRTWYDYDTYFIRAPGVDLITQIYFFTIVGTAVHPGTGQSYPVPDPALTWYFEQGGRFGADALPIYQPDCSQPTSPLCTIKYKINDIVPGSWVVMEHPLPENIIESLVDELTECTGMKTLDINNEAKLKFVLFTPGTPDNFGTIRNTHWVRISNENTWGLFLQDPDIPIECTITFRLQRSFSKIRHRVIPYTIHNLPTNGKQYRENVFAPMLSYMPVYVQSHENCHTTTETRYECTMQVQILGRPDAPIRKFENFLWTEQVHDVFVPGEYYFFTKALTWLEQQDPANQIYRCGYMHVYRLSPDDPRYVERIRGGIFTYEVFPQYQSRISTAFHTFVGDAILNNPLRGIYPNYPLTLHLNGIDGAANQDPKIHKGLTFISPKFGTPSVIARPIITNKSIQQPTFTSTGYSLQTITFHLPLSSMKLDTDFGSRFTTNTDSNNHSTQGFVHPIVIENMKKESQYKIKSSSSFQNDSYYFNTASSLSSSSSSRSSSSIFEQEHIAVDHPIPCIATSSTFTNPIGVDHSYLSSEWFDQLMRIADPTQQVMFLNALHQNGTFTDPLFSSMKLPVPIIGYFTRMYVPPSNRGHTGPHGQKTIQNGNYHYMRFDPIPPFQPGLNTENLQWNFGPAGYTCMYWIPFDSHRPSKKNNVKFTMKLNMPLIEPIAPFNPEDDWFYYSNYPRFYTSATLQKLQTQNNSAAP